MAALNITLEPGETLIDETLATKGSWGHLYLTDRRLMRFGYGPRTLTIPLSEIEGVKLEKGIFGRAINLKTHKWKYYAFTTGSLSFLLGDWLAPFLWRRIFPKGDTTRKWVSMIEERLRRMQQGGPTEMSGA